MRIVVSGTHASGKSTLISDFVLRHPEYVTLTDPFELIDESWDTPGAAMFGAQLRVAADRLTGDELEADVIAERGPVDFLAYLVAAAELTGETLDRDTLERAAAITADAFRHVDLLVVLPLNSQDSIDVGADESLELRDAMNESLLELVDDPDVIGDHLEVVEITGDRDARVDALERFVFP